MKSAGFWRRPSRRWWWRAGRSRLLPCPIRPTRPPTSRIAGELHGGPLQHDVQRDAGNVTYSLVNAFLYNDGNKLAEIYAVNQLSGGRQSKRRIPQQPCPRGGPRAPRPGSGPLHRPGAGQSRRFFFRPFLADLRQFEHVPVQHFAGAYKGYQDYIDRWNVNVGAELGYRLTKSLSLTFGYRGGTSPRTSFRWRSTATSTIPQTVISACSWAWKASHSAG